MPNKYYKVSVKLMVDLVLPARDGAEIKEFASDYLVNKLKLDLNQMDDNISMKVAVLKVHRPELLPPPPKDTNDTK